MIATNDTFRKLSTELDKVVLKVDSDLPLADDIHPKIAQVGAYLAEMLRLPAALTLLEATLAAHDRKLPKRENAVSKASHEIKTLESELAKLVKRIDFNMRAVSSMPTEVPKAPRYAFALQLPASRQDLIDQLHEELKTMTEKLIDERKKQKAAQAQLKGFYTRKANLAKEIGEAKKALADHEGRLPEIIRVLKKTIGHLTNRQWHRDRKNKIRTEINVAETPESVVVEAPKAPSDDDIRAKAEAHGFTNISPEDLPVARQLFT